METKEKARIEIEDEKGKRDGTLSMNFIPEGNGRVELKIEDPLKETKIIQLDDFSVLLEMRDKLGEIIKSRA